MRKGLFDNDIFIKLAACGLIEVACKQLGIEENWVLSSLKPQLRNPMKRGKLAQYFSAWPVDAQSQVLHYCERAKPLPPAEDQAFIDACMSEHRLDIGEVQLIEAAFRSKDAFLVTGDKRFLKQLAGIPELLALALGKLPGRFACFESVLLLLVEQNGVEFVRDRVLPFEEYDGLIKIAFGGGASKTAEQVRAALCYELKQLDESATRLLHYFPE